ncbi:MAG TPA: radical SAM protein [Vicinamibacterales bacterium]|nr:radical SAM protein [Vicinamibacterales bacterium]
MAASALKKRVLIVNGYLPETREPVRLTREIPNTLAPILLAGAFAPGTCEVRIYNEVSSGFLEVFEPGLVQWPDMVVLTGLIASFDRLKQLAAYFRTANPRVVLVAGGQAIRAFRRYSRQFFDYVCVGDVEELCGVVRDVWGAAAVADRMTPRYDLADWIGSVGYAESSRNCNFRCSFCSLTGEGGRYQKQSMAALRQQLDALGRRRAVLFVDNQFYGPDRAFFVERMALLRELRASGRMGPWSAICTNTLLWDEENLTLAREAGCISLFIGVESFDTAWLRRVNKTQNASPRFSQVELIARCIRAGILFQYGIVFDPTERRIADLEGELDLICDSPEIPPPNFIFLAIPFPGTPFFHERLAERRILPNTKARDLEGSTLSLQPLDGIDEVGAAIRRLKYFHGFRQALVRHQARFLWRYRHCLTATQKLVSSASMASLYSPSAFADPRNVLVRKQARTHVSTTDRLDCVYTPRLPVDARYVHHFQPTPITTIGGELSADTADDLLDARYQPVRAVGHA